MPSSTSNLCHCSSASVKTALLLLLFSIFNRPNKNSVFGRLRSYNILGAEKTVAEEMMWRYMVETISVALVLVVS